jgi:competence protein ComEC
VDGPLEVVVATHPHADHIGGLASVLRTFKVLDVWTNGETSTSATYSTFTAAVQTSGASVHTGRRGDEITTGELSFSVLNPVTLTDTTNNNSIVLSLDYGKTSFLFEGDAEKEAEASMLGAGVVPHAEILKAGHHGSKTASSQPFLATVQPEVAIYMAGVGNQYGHPHQETLNALFQIGAKVYGTDVNGNISITTDGKAYTVRLENQALPPPPPPAQTEPSPLPTGKYVGSINSNVYHYPSCRYVEQIHPENLVWFASAAEAQAKGYRPCKVCNPPSATPQPSTPTVTTCSGATAICNDGTCSYSQHRSGTCSHHGGVRQWK